VRVAGKRLLQRYRQHESEGSPERSLPANHLRGVQICERLRQRVVQSPSEGSQNDGACPRSELSRRTAHHEASATPNHQSQRERNAATDRLVVEAPRKQDREARFEVEKQRSSGATRTLEPPSQTNGCEDCPNEGREDKPTSMHRANGSLPSLSGAE